MSRRLSTKLYFLTLASACAGAAFAGPAGPVVGVGSANYMQSALTLTSATARTHISWPSFNLAAGEVLKFVQPNAQSTVLNHIFNLQSQNILGGVSSNGSVLYMSSGMVSGAGMNLDVAGLVNTSLRLPRMALAAGSFPREAQTKPLATLAEGRIYVVGQDALALTAANGDWVLNPGATVELANASSPNFRVELKAPDSAAINLSRLVAGKGEAGIFAGLFRVPEAARQAAEHETDFVAAVAMEDRVSDTPAMARFLRYASLNAEKRGEAIPQEGPAVNAATSSDGPILVAALKSKPSVLPREIEIGASAQRVPAPVIAQAAPAPAAAHVAIGASETQPERMQVALARTDAGSVRPERKAAVIVVARAQQSGLPAAEEGSNVTELRIERRAPRFFQDYRGGFFYM